ncbi:tryptophan-rich sensory protein [Aliigemmobacter aestuarii]|uniref:Tryptophan-rich sensory protein n=1 Tax=Aliigemmobacter aestuarii TaxID=1445661 RepID=A0A4S3MU98_9RHOB|nr:TspO/MBR family protein [Gemmobacter aestuarii]THD85743.1 tryptophan-rich sensory protein [Gemmobacter aestuarii]
MSRRMVHLLFIIGTMASGAAMGFFVVPGQGYADVIRPFFAPPDWLFGPVWTVLYVLIGWAGARSYLDGGAFRLWLLQMALNLTWTPVYFGLGAPWSGLVVIVLLLVAILAFIRAEWPRDRFTALLFAPYSAWVAFATVLNASIAVLN